MGSERRPEAVTFDYWDTLVRADPAATRLARMTRMQVELQNHEIDIDIDVLDTAFDLALNMFNRRWAANEQFRQEQAAALVIDHLRIPADHRARDDLTQAFLTGSQGLVQSLTPGIVGVLDALAAAEIRIGIICDVGLTASPILRQYLVELGVMDRFDHWSFSDEVGVYKPAPVIFEHALDGLAVKDPRRAVHVGDLRRTDVAGARAMGMVSVRYRGVRDDRPGGAAEGDPAAAVGDADHVVDHHRDLLRLVGVGVDPAGTTDGMVPRDACDRHR